MLRRRTELQIMLCAMFLLLVSREAYPECKSPQAFVAPYPTAALPPNPRLYLFCPQAADQAVPKVSVQESDRQPLKFTLQETCSTSCYRVYVLSIDTRDAREFAVEYTQSQGPKASQSFKVDTNWKPPSAQIGLADIETSTFRWLCSFELSKKLHVNAEAPVYEVQWSTTAERFRAGTRESLFIPSSCQWFFGPGSRPPEELNLGHVSCLGYTLQWPVDTLYLGIMAVYPDGTRKAIADAVALSRPETPKDWPQE